MTEADPAHSTTLPTAAELLLSARSENPELVALGQEFARLLAIEEAAWEASSDDDKSSSWKAAEAASEVTREVVYRIAVTPALTIEGVCLKARAVAWCHSAVDKRPPKIAQPSSTTDVRLMHSIIHDLLQRWEPIDESSKKFSEDPSPKPSQRVTKLSEEDQKATGFEHAIWDLHRTVRAGDQVVIMPAPYEDDEHYRIARILRMDRDDSIVAVCMDGTPIDGLTSSSMARVIAMQKSV